MTVCYLLKEILKSNGNIQEQNHIGSPNKTSPSHQSQLKNGYQDNFTQNENYHYYEKCHNFKVLLFVIYRLV